MHKWTDIISRKSFERNNQGIRHCDHIYCFKYSVFDGIFFVFLIFRNEVATTGNSQQNSLRILTPSKSNITFFIVLMLLLLFQLYVEYIIINESVYEQYCICLSFFFFTYHMSNR